MWQYELNKMIAKKPWLLGRWLKPRIIFYPNFFPAYYPMTILHFIFVGKGMKDCPDYVRKYVLAHEYGHIYRLHNLPSYFHYLLLLGVIVGIFIDVEWLAAISFLALIIPSIFLYLKPLKKEFEADDFSVDENEIDVTIDGQQWMTEKTHSQDHPERIARMSRLLKYKDRQN